VRRRGRDRQGERVAEATLDEPLLLAALRQLPAAVIVAEAPSGRIVLSNENVDTILRGAPVPAALQRALGGEHVEREDLRIVRGDGTRAVIRLRAEPLFDGNGAQIGAVLAFGDVTSERKEQSALEMLADGSATTADSLELDPTLSSIVRMAIPRFADLAFVYLLEDDAKLTRHEVAATNPEIEERVRRIWDRYPIAVEPLYKVIESGQPQLTARLGEEQWSFVADEEQRRALASVGMRSVITIPMRHLGVIIFARTGERAFEPMDVLVGEELARRASAAIERSRIYGAERTQRERLEHLQDLTIALAKAVTADDVLDALVAEMGDLVGASIIAVLLLDESRTRLHIARSAGLTAEVEERFREIPIDGDFIAARAARKNEPVWLHTYEEVLAHSPMLRQVPARVAEAWASVPMEGTGGVIGVVTIAFREPQSFGDALCNFILSIARQSAQAIERARLFDSERRARREAEHASQAKDEFLAILSHELRTPMTTVIGWADLLRLTYDGGDPTITMAIESLRAGALTQARLIDDLLDVSRIITGKLQVEKRPTNLGQCVVSAAEALRITAESKGLTLNVDGNGEVWVDADPARLRQIVTNLVANAIKFTPPGGEVDVEVKPRGGTVDAVVCDTGEGIAPDFLPHVFERFRQASIGDSRLHTGLGLGLSIVHHLVQLHGGSVRAESEGAGKGATFTVTLPIAQSS
jgi:signal transduction histidine kinase